MSTPKSYYSSLKYIISQRSKEKPSSYSLPKDYLSHNKDRLFAEKKNLSICELITSVSNENDVGEEIYLDEEDINELKNGFENNEADLSDGSEASIDSSLISVPATISLLERLIRTHPIWLLTNLERSAVNRLLQNKEPGTFIVRNSSNSGTMALSVRLPKGKGPYIEHYLIENLGNRKLHLEGSERYFSVIPMLICHYCQCLDELPVCLKLPEIVLKASRHQLNSLSLLCDKFWTTKFDEQIYSLSDNDESPLQFSLNKKQPRSIDEQKQNADNEQINHNDEQNNNDLEKDDLSHNGDLQSNTKNKSPLNRSSDKMSLDEDRHSIEAKELIFDSEDEDEDHNFIKKEVFSSESCDNKEEEETEVKKHFLMEEQDKVDEQIENQLDELMNLKLKDEEERKDEQKTMAEQEPNKDLPKRPPRKNIAQQIGISPPPLPPRDLKPNAVRPQYFKLSSVSTEVTKATEESHSNKDRKKSVASNLNLLIDFDVLEEEEKLIEQLKENDIFNLNAINAQTQQMLLSSQLNNSDSSIEFNHNSPTNKHDPNEPLLGDQMNITKIEVNTGVANEASRIQEKLDEFNLIELKLNESKEELEDVLLQSKEKCVEQKVEPLIVQSSIIEPIDMQPLIGQQSSLLIQPLIAQKIEICSKQKQESKTDKLNNYEDIWRGPDLQPKQRVPKVETRDCEVQTDAQTILNDLKLERYRNFLVYDYAPNLKSTNISAFTDQIYGTSEDLVCFQHFIKNRNLSNPNLNQLANSSNNPISKNTESHSFESLYVTYDSVYSKQTYFFERHIVPRDSNLSDVCLQVGDGLLKDPAVTSSSRKNSIIRTELVDEERIKLANEKKQQMKDVAWQVDSSWQVFNGEQLNRSISSEDEEELANSIANNENISTKYRRFSCKYIIESGVESDSDGELNEHGLQSLLDDNVRLDGFDLSATHSNMNESKVKAKRGVNQSSFKNNNEKPANSSPPMMLVETEEPCSSGFWESQQQQQLHTSSNNKTNELKQSTNEQMLLASSSLQQNTRRNLINTKQKHRQHDETEDDDEMVFQEILGLDDVYTTNDELDDNHSMNRQEEEEDIYTVTAPNVTYSTVAKSISEYIFELQRLNDNVFAKSICNFIQCTKELYESNPMVIMRNIRQFMNGMKNYLIKHGEKEFLDFVKHERKRLKPEEFLNLEAIISACLHKLVLRPLKDFIYAKFVSMEFRFGYESFMKLNENIAFLSARLPEEFEIQSNVRLPSSKNMKRIAKFFSKLQGTYSPLKKLEYILSVVSIINYNTKIIEKQTVDGKMIISKQRIDERTFVSVFIYLLVKFNVVNIEIEIDYIWSLIQPNLVNGDAGYYLSMLSSCVYVLKCNFMICQERNHPLNTIELQRSMITSYLPSLNDSLNAKCKLSLFQKEIGGLSNNLVLPKIIDHPNVKNLKNSKKRNHTFNQNINELTLVNSNFVQSYPSALNNYRQDSFFRTNVLQNNNLVLKFSSLFTICCLKILILDEFTGNINCKLLVIKPEMLAKEFSRLIAQKFAIFNYEEYSLFLLTQEGKEFQIDDNELPFSIKINAIKYGMNLSFVFKRTDSQYVFSNKFYELNHFQSF